MVTVGSYWGNKALDYLVNRDTFVSLHTYDPTVTGIPASEVTGGDYARDFVNYLGWNNAASRQVTNNQIVEFNNLAPDIITYIGVWDALTGGNIIASGAFLTPITVVDGDQIRVLGGELVISL